ncbi:hypothetical protein [Streptomyces boluensis]|uniref:PknH-like extracellular domain-containing protein n=1 Tax=Streptomyces boluensis TaxID=1775135 RepID=A0A964V344_9ACTN|nr:hypothetical protein [Streptomyces boluensis]NBE56325.1 hypothetical protein [Streptomyces boluensis]
MKPLLLREADVRPWASGVTVQAPAPRYDPPVRVAGADCRRVFDALVAQGASTSVIQDFWWKGDRWTGRTWMASYADTAAETRFDELREGLKTCEALVGQTPEGKLNSRITMAKTPVLGDGTNRSGEAVDVVAFDLSMDGADRTVVTDRHIFVRIGAVTVDVADRGNARRPSEFPIDEVADKQLDRLARRTP